MISPGVVAAIHSAGVCVEPCGKVRWTVTAPQGSPCNLLN